MGGVGNLLDGCTMTHQDRVMKLRTGFGTAAKKINKKCFPTSGCVAAETPATNSQHVTSIWHKWVSIA